jgi:3-oxoacyl-[acyl-carrier protein] reductase
MTMTGKKALLLGASSKGGLGEATARRLVADGAEVIVAGRRLDPLEALAADIGATALVCDVTDEDSIVALAARAGAVDILVNAAGTTLGQSILKLRREQIDAQYAVHVTANLLLMKHVVPSMPVGGSVVLFSSVTSQSAGHGLAAYAAAKAALDQVVRIAAIEFGPRGIRVNAVAPGFCVTPMTEGFLKDPHFAELYRRETAMGGFVTPDQVAAAVAWLASPDCYMTGDIMQVSGGAQLMRMPRLDELMA